MVRHGSRFAGRLIRLAAISIVMKTENFIAGNTKRSTIIDRKAKLWVKVKRFDVIRSNVAWFVACFSTAIAAVHASKAVALKDRHSPFFVFGASADFVMRIGNTAFPQWMLIALWSVALGAFSAMFRCISRTLSAAVEASRKPAFPPRMIFGRSNLELLSIWNPALSQYLSAGVLARNQLPFRQICHEFLSTGSTSTVPRLNRIRPFLKSYRAVLAGHWYVSVCSHKSLFYHRF
jgi:hypothetical protein